MNQETSRPSVWLRLLLCLLILAAGAGGMTALKKLRRPPAVHPPEELILSVETITAQPRDYRLTLRGYGDIVSRTVLTLSAEISGRIVFARPALEAGMMVHKDDVLFRIDPRDHELDLNTAVSRITTLKQELELAEAEFSRISRLYRQKKVGSQSSVEQAESRMLTIRNQLAQLEQNRQRAEIRLERCTIRAPFDARIREVKVEAGEYVTPGKQLLTLVDDRSLEVIVPLDSRDGARWLQFESKDNTPGNNWFARPVPVPCELVWSENRMVKGKGVVDRIVRFDAKTRLLLIAVRLTDGGNGPVPLVEGMFCRVAIEGRTLPRIFVIPRKAVTFNGTVYLAENGRLHTRKVEVLREEGENALIGKGLNPGDLVIITRLEHPLENTRVRILDRDDDGSPSGPDPDHASATMEKP